MYTVDKIWLEDIDIIVVIIGHMITDNGLILQLLGCPKIEARAVEL